MHKQIRYYSNKFLTNSKNNKPSSITNHLGKFNLAKSNQPSTSKILSNYLLNPNKQNYSNSDSKLNVRTQILDFDNGKRYARTTVNCSDQSINAPNLIIIADKSGSMTESSTELKELCKFSKFDLVKHSLELILNSLPTTQNFGLVMYNNDFDIIHPYNPIGNNKNLIKNINNILPSGGTNVSNSVKYALDVAKKSNNLTHIIILTDGLFNDTTELNRILNQIDHNDLSNIKIHTIAYGYDIDSHTLANIADKFNGMFLRIPDISMSQTIWTNILTNLYLENDYKFNIITNLNKWHHYYPTNIINTIPKHFIHEIPENFDTDKLEMSIDFRDQHNNQISLEKSTIISQLDKSETLISLNVCLRNKISQHINNFLNKKISVDDFKKSLINIQSIIDSSEVLRSDSNLLKLSENIQSYNPNCGQILKAIQPEYIRKWGFSYLLSIKNNLDIGLCTNFKDTILQINKSDFSEELEEEISDIVSNIQYPTASNGNATQQTYSAFYNSSTNPNGPCIDGNCYTMIRQSINKFMWVRVKDLKKDDTLINGAKILCVIKTNFNTFNPINMLNISGVRITKFHPIKISTSDKSDWILPIDLDNKYKDVKHHQPIYSFVLDGSGEHSMKIYSKPSENNYVFDMITLGHQITTNKVLYHPYFGNKIIDELIHFKGWNEGLIVINKYKPDYEINENGDLMVTSLKNCEFE